MDSFINWFEIPAEDFKRAVGFYSAVLSATIEETEFFGSQMGFLPSDGTNVSGAIVAGEDYQPSTAGTLIYLNGGRDLQSTLDRVEPNGGKVVVPKTRISEEMGYFAIFIDSEGNKMALHSIG